MSFTWDEEWELKKLIAERKRLPGCGECIFGALVFVLVIGVFAWFMVVAGDWKKSVDERLDAIESKLEIKK